MNMTGIDQEGREAGQGLQQMATDQAIPEWDLGLLQNHRTDQQEMATDRKNLGADLVEHQAGGTAQERVTGRMTSIDLEAAGFDLETKDGIRAGLDGATSQIISRHAVAAVDIGQ